MTNLAAIDIGSNAMRMLVSRMEMDGSLTALENLRLPVRLGQDAFTRGSFSEQTIQLALDAFLRFRQVADLFEVEQVRVAATSAMRESANSDLLVDRVNQEVGFNIEIISGEEEARLIHLAVSHALDLHGWNALLVDIGGGSVEVTLSDGVNILASESFGIGTVRLLSKLNQAREGNASLTQLLSDYAASAHRAIEREFGSQRVDFCIGTGGSIEEMGKLRRRVLNRKRSDTFSGEDLGMLITRLGGMTVEERVKNLGINPDRADVILPAMIVLQMILHEAHVDIVQVPGVGLKDGLLLEMVSASREPRLPRRLQVLASVERMARKFTVDEAHAAITANLACRLFDQSLSLHHLAENERLLLEVAARLHDIGHYINTIDHDRHGHYLIKHHPLIGLTSVEQEIVASIVFYHRRQTPAASDETIKALPQKDRVVITKLCALLRLADSLDISHMERVQDVILEQREPTSWSLFLAGSGEPGLEKWALERRKSLFQEVFGVILELV